MRHNHITLISKKNALKNTNFCRVIRASGGEGIPLRVELLLRKGEIEYASVFGDAWPSL